MRLASQEQILDISQQRPGLASGRTTPCAPSASIVRRASLASDPAVHSAIGRLAKRASRRSSRAMSPPSTSLRSRLTSTRSGASKKDPLSQSAQAGKAACGVTALDQPSLQCLPRLALRKQQQNPLPHESECSAWSARLRNSGPALCVRLRYALRRKVAPEECQQWPSHRRERRRHVLLGLPHPPPSAPPVGWPQRPVHSARGSRLLEYGSQPVVLVTSPPSCIPDEQLFRVRTWTHRRTVTLADIVLFASWKRRNGTRLRVYRRTNPADA